MAGPFDELLFPESLRESVLTAPPDAARWLEGASSREVLQRLLHGDPLGIEARCACRIRERALLIARERVVMRAAAQVAFHAPSYREWQPMHLWLRGHIDRAMHALLERDRAAELANEPPEDDEAWGFLTRALGIDPQGARRAALAFNDLPLSVRRVFWRTMVEGAGEERCVADGLGTLTQIHERSQRALATLSLGVDPGGADGYEREDFQHG
jgi:hypothetical protein